MPSYEAKVGLVETYKVKRGGWLVRGGVVGGDIGDMGVKVPLESEAHVLSFITKSGISLTDKLSEKPGRLQPGEKFGHATRKLRWPRSPHLDRGIISYGGIQE